LSLNHKTNILYWFPTTIAKSSSKTNRQQFHICSSRNGHAHSAHSGAQLELEWITDIFILDELDHGALHNLILFLTKLEINTLPLPCDLRDSRGNFRYDVLQGNLRYSDFDPNANPTAYAPATNPNTPKPNTTHPFFVIENNPPRI